jgi:hypothetical protein
MKMQRLSKFSLCLMGLIFSLQLHAQSNAPDWFFTPSVAMGFNTVQGTYYSLGMDLGMYFTDSLYAGIGGFYTAGNHPTDDRELGGGPFIGYVLPLFEFMSLRLREDLDYVDQRDPFLVSSNPDVYNHTLNFGWESATYAGVHFRFTRNFGLSAGYRLVIGLTNSALANGRSGAVLGATIGF